MIKPLIAAALATPFLAAPAIAAQSVCYYRPSVSSDWDKVGCEVNRVSELDSRDSDNRVVVWYVKRNDSPITLRFLPWNGGEVEVSAAGEHQKARWVIDADRDYRVTMSDGSQFTWRPPHLFREQHTGPRLRPGMLQGTPFNF